MDKSLFPVYVGISGASGAVYALRLVESLLKRGAAVHVTTSAQGAEIIHEESGRTFDDWFSSWRDLGSVQFHANDDLGAPPASGSFRTGGTVIVPCSMGTLGRIAAGVSGTLIERAADVSLKERRTCILVARETPLSLIHLENMVRVTRAGAVVMPPVPAMYTHPTTIDDIVGHTVDRILDHLGVENESAYRWKQNRV